MGNSPKETTTKNGDERSPVQSNASPPKVIEPDTKADDLKADTINKDTARPAAAIAEPPADYFSVQHGLSSEANPFEVSFGGGGPNGGPASTPNGTKLPSVAALTSPSGMLGGSGITPGFWNSLRNGPLSPAMLSGPQKDDYFSDSHTFRGFPTPNESSMRSGLSPGGSGSMFPEPSPNSQAIFNSLQSGGATPNTLDFHRTAMNAAAAAHKRETTLQQANITSQPQERTNGLEVKPPVPGHFEQHEANDAANGLYLLAQARNGPQPTNHYTMAPQIGGHGHPQMMQMGGQSSETSPHMANRNGGSISTNSGRGVSEMSGMSDDNEQQSRPNTRGKGKRNSTQDNQTNGGKKNGAKGPANKKAKANNGNAMNAPSMSDDEADQEQEPDMSKDEYNANGKKMTDEEKRKNFLERNRVAALKCRQRKKQWLANLQQKVEIYSAENDNLNAQLSQLRDEVVNLKTMLLAHKDCPISQQQQGIQGMSMNDGFHPQMNPYGMAMANQQQQQQQIMAGQGIPRRFS